MKHILGQTLVAYSHLPHHPGKGLVFDRLLPRVAELSQGVRLRTRYGVHFECDLSDKPTREIYYTGFDRRDCRVLRRLTAPGQVMLDIGANVGYFSLLFAKWAGPSGIVHAFEPFPATARRFQRNLDLNPSLQKRIHVHRLAISDFVGALSMSVVDASNSGCNHLDTNGPGGIPVTTLDEFLRSERLSRVDIIKVDVEGSEVALLSGAADTIMRFRPILMLEVNLSTLQRFGKTCADVVELLGRYRYRLSYATRLGTLQPLRRLPVYGEEPNIFAFPID